MPSTTSEPSSSKATSLHEDEKKNSVQWTATSIHDDEKESNTRSSSTSLPDDEKGTNTQRSSTSQPPVAPAEPIASRVIPALHSEDSSKTQCSKYSYITGIYGILVIQSFIWLYMSTFIPTLASSHTPGPTYQKFLRFLFSVPLWDESLVYNAFIILSMRNIAVGFLENPKGSTYAATVIRRIVRLVFIVCIASGLTTFTFSQIGVEYIKEFKTKLPNDSIKVPMQTYSGFAALNLLFNFFWITGEFYTQAANNFWPSNTLWVTSVIYYQSFTVYFLMVILPFTRPRWHFSGLGLFALGSFWMSSWGWYSATGLFLADMVINPELKNELRKGLRVKHFLIQYWVIAVALFAMGVALKYSFISVPEYENSMLVMRPYLDLSTKTSVAQYVAEGPYPRVNDWLVVLGAVLGVELFPMLQRALSHRLLVALGRRSFSIFVAQCLVFWTAGIKLWLALRHGDKMGTAGANAVVFLTCLPAIALLSELFYQVIDGPSRPLSAAFYRWLTN